MLRKILAVLLGLTFMLGTMAVSYAATYTSSPSQITCVPNGDTKTQIGLAWVTNTGTTGSVAQLRVKGSGSDFGTAFQFTGTTGLIQTYRWHKVTVTGLNSNTKYEYRVGDGTTWSGICEFETAPASMPGSFTFIQCSDPQDATAGVWSNTISRAFTKFADSKFVLMSGDHVDTSLNEDQWAKYFSESQAMLTKTTFSSVSGNHDSGGGIFASKFNYDAATPASDQATGTYYSFDYGNMHVTALNTGNCSAAQANWAKYDIVKNAKKWNVVNIHRPMYTNGDHWNDNSDVVNSFKTLIDDLGVDVVYGGHDHIYNRTYPLKNGQVVSGNEKQSNVNVNGTTLKDLYINPVGTINTVNNTAGSKYYTQNASVTAAHKALFAYQTQPNRPSFAGVTVTENEFINSCYYIPSSGSDTLIESWGIRKTAAQVKAPTNVKVSWAGNNMSISWEAPSDTTVRGYVVYDENNAYTTAYYTNILSAASRNMSLLMSEATYNKTKFVVKALGNNSISETGTTQGVTSGATISGSVSPLISDYAGEVELVDLHNSFGKAKIELYNAANDTLVKTVYAEATSGTSAAFNIDGIANGSYYIMITRAGMGVIVKEITVSGSNINLGAQTFAVGSGRDGAEKATTTDAMECINTSKNGKNGYGEANYKLYLDTNGDGVIDNKDCMNMINALKKK